jgi:Cof subfamily protein (haloacid dehalogenase superfamily)
LAADVRLIALDLDGTLLNPSNQISDEDAAAVREAVAAGVRVVLATARWHGAAARTAQRLGLDGYVISHNGALVRSCDATEELLHLRIEEGLTRRLAEHIDGLDGDAYLTIAERTFVRSPRFAAAARLPADMELTDRLARSVTGPATAILLFGKEAVRNTIERFRDEATLNLAEGFSESFPDYLNIVDAGADKGRALLHLCEELSIEIECVMAVGDAAPDVPMLEAAGIGVAMGNAPQTVKAAANLIAPSNSDAGVAWAIRNHVLG